MGNTRDTGFLRNFITRDGSGNVTISGNVLFSGTVSGYATESYVGTQLAALVASAPTTLNTLNELATALGNDPNFATTITTSIGTKLPLSGGTLTGLLDIAQEGGATQVAGLRLTNTSNAANTGSFLAFKDGGYATDTSRIVSMRDGAGNGSIFYITNRVAGSLEYALYINSSNKVGINTSSPATTLDVYAATSATIANILRLKNGYNDPSTGLRMKWDFASLDGAYLDVTTDSGGSKSMILYLSAANATPTQAFQILGSNKAASFTGSVTASGGLITKGSSVNVNNSIKFLRADGPEMGYIGWSNESANNSTWLFKSSNGNPIALSADGINQNMVITTGGNVGIGQVTPAYTLDVNGSARMRNEIWLNSSGQTSLVFQQSDTNKFNVAFNTAGWLQFFNYTTGGTSMSIFNSSNVAIGTTTDSGYPFIVAKARDGWQAAFVNVSSYGTQQVFLAHGEGYGAYIDSGSAGNSSSRYIFKAVSGGSARFTVRGDGNVGIGTESPSHRLQVAGNIYSTDTVFGRNLKPESWAGISAGSPSSAGIPLGYSSINISSLCDNNWRTILSNINDTKVFMWVVLGDAASKDTASYTWQMTSPAYGVSNFAQISYLDGGWNTGGFEFTYSSANGTYSLLVRTTSYYSSSYTAQGNIYFLRIE